MTGRTHDLAAFTALNIVFSQQPLFPMSLATFAVALGANMVGGLAPDVDQPTADLWGKIRGGTILSRLISPILGGHRFISHSILGIALMGKLLEYFLHAISKVLIVDMTVIWWSFMIGYLSHIVTDMLTKEGVPLFFPLPWKIGFPPLRFMRIKTGGILEKSFIFPGLIIANGYLFYLHYGKYLEFFKEYIK